MSTKAGGSYVKPESLDGVACVAHESSKSMKEVVFLGCDPGRSGAFAVIGMSGKLITVYSWSDDLLMNIKRLEAIRGAAIAVDAHIVAIVEQVHSMPAQGVKSSFTFGQAYGEMRASLAAVRIGYDQVTPAKWQKEVGVKRKPETGKTQHKRNMATKARELYPNIHFNIPQADAVLLAHWLREKYLRRL